MNDAIGPWRSAVWMLSAVLFMSSVLPAPTAEPPDAPTIRVAVYDDAGSEGFAAPVLKALSHRPEVTAKRVTAAEVRDGRLDAFDILIQPGGTAGGQARALGKEGLERVREFVKSGGGYVGICAGTYLAVGNDDRSLNLIDAKLVDVEHWARGVGTVDLAVSDKGRKTLGINSATVAIYYENGPLLAPAGDPDLPDYEPLATFAGEVAENGASKGAMTGTAAIAAGRYGKGHVLCFSPHPEKSDGMKDVLYRGVLWAGR